MPYPTPLSFSGYTMSGSQTVLPWAHPIHTLPHSLLQPCQGQDDTGRHWPSGAGGSLKLLLLLRHHPTVF